MKKFIKVLLSLVAVLAAIAGILAGLKLFLEKFGKKKTESEEFTFEGDELDDIELYSEDDTVEIDLDRTPEDTAE
jgi:hypothetical protein